MKRSIKDYILIVLKGMAMGASDVVPGVSGGTIAFITGIYDELITSIKSIGAHSVALLFKRKIKEFWKAINGNFLTALVIGIAISVFSLAKLITYLLINEPVLVWSFFFGLVLASSWFVSREVKEWNYKTLSSFFIGAILAFFITVATPAETPTALWFVFLCGAVAICAMILPGISGSFILVLLGKYFYVMEALNTLNIAVLFTFGAGALVGLMSFSRLLSYALKNFRNITLAMLSGFMLGSLNKVWPWKEIETVLRNGQEFSLEHNVAPHEQIVEGLALMLIGFVLVYVIEKISDKS